MEEFQVKPMGLGEILDTSYLLMKKNWKLILSVTGVALLPFYILFGWLFISFLPRVLDNPYWFVETPPSSFIFFLLLVTGFALAIFLTEAAMVKTVGEIFLKNPVTVFNSYQAILPKLAPLVWASSLAGVFIGLGSLLIIPGIIVFLIYFILVPVIMLESASGMAALGRSRYLMREEKLKAFWAMLLIACFSWFCDFVLGLIPSGLFQYICGSFFQWLVITYASVVTVVFYFQVSASKENFNLERLSKVLA